ncbi:hypothetical protein A3E89_01555 [Candidatus Campbellbacteria bacterium RIFCSPHIGHO2_12_FULL_35_10]|uniref:Uncharacterized protein n=1 Tax=Candidatus Campbellbacteria bacterium RIFCSPHIGHO2_12_FULL_35_10 TaxID=1797578 RepID=A0A1F5EPZ4_9BACT|nr:MAG: hypothetical protein A3E89_01555 [Candidatus Campbellbacteria bacterium RIFCSPHIGHO2_12_FULL_35_10]
MKTISILSAILIFVASPLLGIPGVWKTSLILILAVVIFIKSFYSYRISKTMSAGENSTFKQNGLEDNQDDLFSNNSFENNENQAN